MKKSSKKTSKEPSKKTSKKGSRRPLKKPSTKLLKRPSIKKLLKKTSKKPSVKLSKKASKKPAIKRSTKPSPHPLWIPSKARIKNANMTRFIEFANRKYGKKFRTYRELYQWSVDSIPDFWEAVWDFTEIKASKKFDQVVDDLKKFPGAKWFVGAKLNFAENLLRYRDNRLAFIF